MKMYESAQSLEKRMRDDPILLSDVLSASSVHDAAGWHKKPRTDSRVAVQPHEVTGDLMASALGNMLGKKLDEDSNGKVAAAKKALELAAAWQQCGRGCVCGRSPCMIAGLRRCDNCKKIQIKVCGRRPCVQLRQQLLEALPAPMPAPTDSDQATTTPAQAPTDPSEAPTLAEPDSGTRCDFPNAADIPELSSV